MLVYEGSRFHAAMLLNKHSPVNRLPRLTGINTPHINIRGDNPLMSTTTLAQRIRTARLTAGYSQKKLAPKVGCSRAQIVALEKGRTDNPSAILLFSLADTLDVNPRWLITGRGLFAG